MTTPSPVPGAFRVFPWGFTMSTLEQVPLSFDTTLLLTGSQTPSSPSSVMTDITTTANSVVSLSDAPTVSGNKVLQEVRGSELTAGHTYLLSITFVADSSTTWEMVQQISVPF